MGYQMVTSRMTSRDPERSNSWPKYAKIQYLHGRSNVFGRPGGCRTNNL